MTSIIAPEMIDRHAAEESRGRIEAFLTAHGVTIDAVLLEIGADPEDVVLGVGSVPEGMGTPISDLDIIVLGPKRRPTSIVFNDKGRSDSVFRMGDILELNVEYVAAPALEALADDVAQALFPETPTGEMRLKRLSEGELNILHRIRCGVVLAGAADSWRQRLLVEYLPEYMTVFYLMFFYALREDAIALQMIDDPDNSGFIWKQAVSNLATSTLAASGETNNQTKWRLKLVERNLHRLGGETADFFRETLMGPVSIDRSELDRQSAIADQIIVDALRDRPMARAGLEEVRKHVSFVLATPAAEYQALAARMRAAPPTLD
jgi:hypothetical protein